jgi:hypothetical protein
MRKHPFLAITVAAIAATAMAACSPKYNWRDYNSPDAPYRIMFPAKPATYTRSVDLNGMKVDMTMTATEVDGAMFAVGSAQAPDPAAAQAALNSMKIALVRNIGGTITSEKPSAVAAVGGGQPNAAASSDVVADGVMNGVKMRLIGHFEARGNRFYQVVVMGPAKAIEQEQSEQFLSSFKLQ